MYTFDFPLFLPRFRKDFNSARFVGFRLDDFPVVRFCLVARIPFFAMPVFLDESTSFKLRKVQRVRHPTAGRGAPLDRITNHTDNNCPGSKRIRTICVRVQKVYGQVLSGQTLSASSSSDLDMRSLECAEIYGQFLSAFPFDMNGRSWFLISPFILSNTHEYLTIRDSCGFRVMTWL